MIERAIPVRFIAKYDRMGDGPGEVWAKAVLDHAMAEDQIFDYQILAVETGIWGLEHIIFSFDVTIQDRGYDAAKALGEEIAVTIVGETDVTLLTTSSLVGRSRQKPDLLERGGEMPDTFYRVLFGEHNPNWTKRPDWNYMFVKGVHNYMNDRLQSRGYVFLNEAYEALGIDRTGAGQIVGWHQGASNYVDIRYDASMNEGTFWLNFHTDGPIVNMID